MSWKYPSEKPGPREGLHPAIKLWIIVTVLFVVFTAIICVLSGGPRFYIPENGVLWSRICTHDFNRENSVERYFVQIDLDSVEDWQFIKELVDSLLVEWKKQK